MFLLLATLFVFVHKGVAIDYGYKHIGCFVGKANRGDREMPFLGMSYFDPIRYCAERAKNDGFRTFGIQSGISCYGGPEASNTYNKYGPSTKCSKGVGGTEANDIYQYPEYLHIGCFKDSGEGRALPEYLGKFPADQVVEKCAAGAKAKHYPIFAVQYDVECWTGPKDEQEYNKYGTGTGCHYGRGGDWRNDVYSFERYNNVGCFLDKPTNHSIPFVIHTIYPAKTAVANCASRAESQRAIGFAVQHDYFGRRCYSIKDKNVNYGVYGKASACVGGVGGVLANDVYMFF